MKHTPGPWIVVDERTTSGYPIKAIRRGDEKSVYNIALLGDRMPSASQWQPNANLIAAAPDLLEALTDFVLYLGDDFETPSEMVLVAKARRAIAKARGES